MGDRIHERGKNTGCIQTIGDVITRKRLGLEPRFKKQPRQRAPMKDSRVGLSTSTKGLTRGNEKGKSGKPRGKHAGPQSVRDQIRGNSASQKISEEGWARMKRARAERQKIYVHFRPVRTSATWVMFPRLKFTREAQDDREQERWEENLFKA